jgi:hypothetical protein
LAVTNSCFSFCQPVHETCVMIKLTNGYRFHRVRQYCLTCERANQIQTSLQPLSSSGGMWKVAQNRLSPMITVRAGDPCRSSNNLLKRSLHGCADVTLFPRPPPDSEFR